MRMMEVMPREQYERVLSENIRRAVARRIREEMRSVFEEVVRQEENQRRRPVRVRRGGHNEE